jgi:hypothetical protein
LTDAKGVFRARGIEKCCRVLFDKEGFEAVGPSDLQVRAGLAPEPLHLTMLPWPELRGRLLDPERRPVNGCTVEAISVLGFRKTTKTSNDGAFSFEHQFPSGNYVLMAIPPVLNATGPAELAPTYFPNTAEHGDAAKLVLKAADEFSGYDIIVRRAPVFNVTGVVLDERGEPAAGAVLQVPTAAAKATADANGRFEWTRVRPGAAVVQADWRRADIALRGFAPITLQDRALEDLTVRLAPPVPVSGSIEVDGRPAQVDGTATLEPVNGEGSPAHAPF